MAALKETSESGLDAFARVDLDESLAKFRASPQYKAAQKADDDRRLANGPRAGPRAGSTRPPMIPFDFSSTRPRGQEGRARRFQGKGRRGRLLGDVVWSLPRGNPVS